MTRTAGESHDLFVVFTVAFAAGMVNVDNYIVNIALPTITDYFGMDTGRASWISMSYLIAMVTTMLIVGRLADRIGVRKVFVGGYALFTAASLLCGLSPGFGWLIAFRVLQGFGGSMLYVGGFAVVPRYLPPGRSGWAFGITSTAAGFGMMAGAPLGGIITQYLSWHWIFLINVPIGLAAVIWTCRVIPGERSGPGEAEERVPFDIPGCLLSLAGLLALVFAVNQGQEMGWLSRPILACGAVAAVCLTIFIVRQFHQRYPLIDPGLFRVRDFRLGLFAAFAVFVLFAGSNFILPFYLRLSLGLSSSHTGLVMMIYSLVYLISAPPAGRLSDRVSASAISLYGMLSAALACLFFALTLHRTSMLPAVVFLAWLALSLGFFFSPNNKMVIGAIAPEHRGVGIGVFRTICHLASLFGVCLYETVFSGTLPGFLDSGGTSHLQAGWAKEAVGTAFRNAYLFGAGLAGAAIISMVVSGGWRQPAGAKARRKGTTPAGT
jgi:EmrB/QacA subfamily drug resistance transporter